MSKSSKYILAAGCSFTDPNFKSKTHPDMDTSFPKWPEILGEYLDLKAINLGFSGTSNEYITNNVTQHILKNHKKIELVAIGWTEIQRFTIYNTLSFNPNTILFRPNEPQRFHNESARELYKYIYDEYLISHSYNISDPEKWNMPTHENLFTWQVRMWFNQMFQIQEICKLYGIKFVMAPLCGSIEIARYKQSLNMIEGVFNFTYEQWAMMYEKINELYDLDPKHYWGYPFLKALDGDIMAQSINVREYRMSNEDVHPNAKGHEWIAREFYELYEKIYS